MKTLAPLTSLLVILAGPIYAQQPGGQGGQGGPPPPPPPSPLVKALDADGDGIISAAEIANAPAALKTLDKNNDGKLTQNEFRPPHPPGGGPQGGQGGPGGGGKPPQNGGPVGGQGNGGPAGHHPPPLVQALDADGDGTISAAEIANASAALLKLDKNGDGQLTRDEFAPPPPPPQGDGQGGQGGPGGQKGQQPPKNGQGGGGGKPPGKGR